MFDLKSIGKNLKPAIGLTLGSVGSGLATRYIPVADDRIKNGLVFLGGLLLMGSGKGKDKLLGSVGMGLVAGSGDRLVAAFLPGIKGIGEPNIDFDIDDIQGPGNDNVVSGAEGANNDIAM